jgi:hypothetical protein
MPVGTPHPVKEVVLLFGPSLNQSLTTESKAAAAASAAIPSLGFVLHLLWHLHVDVEELGGASVKTHALALVEVAFAVVVGNALLGTDTVETVVRTCKRMVS